MKHSHTNELIPSPKEVIDLTKKSNSSLKQMVRIIACQQLFKDIKHSNVVTNMTGEPIVYKTYPHKN